MVSAPLPICTPSRLRPHRPSALPLAARLDAQLLLWLPAHDEALGRTWKSCFVQTRPCKPARSCLHRSRETTTLVTLTRVDCLSTTKKTTPHGWTRRDADASGRG